MAANAHYAQLFDFASADACVGLRPGGRWEAPQSGGLEPEPPLRLASARSFSARCLYRRPDGSAVPLLFRAMPSHGVGEGDPAVRVTFVVPGATPPPEYAWEAESIANAALLHERESVPGGAAARQSALADFALAALREPSTPRLAERGCRLLAEQLSAPLAKVLERTEAVGGLRLIASVGFRSFAEPHSLAPDLPAGFALRVGGAVLLIDESTETRFHPSPMLRAHDVRSGITVPILAQGRAWGSLGAYDTQPRTFTADDVWLAEAVAALLGERIAREAAEHERDRLNRLVEAAPLLAGTFSADGRLRQLNAAARRALGFGVDEAVDTLSITDIFAPTGSPSDRAEVTAILSKGGTYTRECAAKPRGGEPFVAAVSIQGHTDDAGVLRTCSFFGLDVTPAARDREALRLAHEEVQRLARRLARDREEQARHCAMELHDDLGQTLAAARLAVAAIDRAPLGEGPRRVGLALGTLEEAFASLRRISRSMRPFLDPEASVFEAFARLCANQSDRVGMPVQFRGRGAIDSVDRDVATALYRVTQEALSNVARHAQARSASCSLLVQSTRVCLRVEDDGRGFDAADTSRPRGMGLVGMRERALACGGSFSCTSRPGRGTLVRVDIPMPQASGDASHRSG